MGQELRNLVLVAANRDDVEPVVASLLVQPLGDGAVVPLGQQLGLVPGNLFSACPPRSRACAMSGRAAAPHSTISSWYRSKNRARPRSTTTTRQRWYSSRTASSGRTRAVSSITFRSRTGRGSSTSSNSPRPEPGEERHRLWVQPLLVAASSMRATSPRSERRASRSSPESLVSSRAS